MSNLNDIKIKKVPIALDKKRYLKFDLNAFSELEDKYGDINKAFEKLQAGSVKAIRCLLWAALIHEDKELTEEDVGAMIDMQNLPEVMDAITKAFDAATPEIKNPMPNQIPKK